MAKNAIPEKCKECTSLWTAGVKDGKHDRWCCKFGQPAPKIISHCTLTGGFKARQEAAAPAPKGEQHG
jgi:hypothetical protein